MSAPSTRVTRRFTQPAFEEHDQPREDQGETDVGGQSRPAAAGE